MILILQRKRFTNLHYYMLLIQLQNHHHTYEARMPEILRVISKIFEATLLKWNLHAEILRSATLFFTYTVLSSIVCDSLIVLAKRFAFITTYPHNYSLCSKSNHLVYGDVNASGRAMLHAITYHHLRYLLLTHSYPTLIARFMRPTWGPSGADRTQVCPMLTLWTLFSGKC